MAKKRSGHRTIFFPWERGGGFWRGRGVSRAKPFALALVVAAVVLLLGMRESRLAGIRGTRATLGVVHAAVEAYRADNDRRCPSSLDALKAEGYLESAPEDAWGRPLRLECPGRKDLNGYELQSDGPDRVIGGLDRVE